MSERPPRESWADDPLGARERAALAEEVAAALRHDLRNNLSGIRNAAFFLKRRTSTTALWAEDPRMEQFFTIIEDMVDASAKMLENGLSLQHLFARVVACVPGRECIELACAAARVPAGVVFDIILDADPGDIEVDRAEVALAIRCLLENAAEATTGGGRIKVSTQTVQRSFVVEVTDGGAGLSEVDRKRLFEPFHTTKPGHSGLGLNIARRVAHRYSGDLVLGPATSETSLILSLPLCAPGARAEGAGNHPESPLLG